MQCELGTRNRAPEDSGNKIHHPHVTTGIHVGSTVDSDLNIYSELHHLQRCHTQSAMQARSGVHASNIPHANSNKLLGYLQRLTADMPRDIEAVVSQGAAA